MVPTCHFKGMCLQDVSGLPQLDRFILCLNGVEQFVCVCVCIRMCGSSLLKLPCDESCWTSDWAISTFFSPFNKVLEMY